MFDYNGEFTVLILIHASLVQFCWISEVTLTFIFHYSPDSSVFSLTCFGFLHKKHRSQKRRKRKQMVQQMPRTEKKPSPKRQRQRKPKILQRRRAMPSKVRLFNRNHRLLQEFWSDHIVSPPVYNRWKEGEEKEDRKGKRGERKGKREGAKEESQKCSKKEERYVANRADPGRGKAVL